MFFGIDLTNFFVCRNLLFGNTLDIERRNSKVRSGYIFWLILQKTFAAFWLTPKVKSDTDMINPSIESSDFLFWHEKILSWVFEDFVKNRQTKFHILKFRVCVNTHTKFELVKCTLSISHTIFKNPTPNFFMPKEKIRAFDWWVDHICVTFNFQCEKAAKVFCKMSQKVYPERTFEFRLSLNIYFRNSRRVRYPFVFYSDQIWKNLFLIFLNNFCLKVGKN